MSAGGEATGHRATLVAFGLAILAGVVDFLGFCGFGLFPLTWIAMVPVLWAARTASPRRALLLGWVFGTVGMLGGYYWVSTLLIQFAEASWLMGQVGLLALCAYQGLQLALPIYAARRAQRALGVAPVWTLVIVYPAVELLFPLLFPFRIGNSQYAFSAITQVVELFGLLALTALIGLVNGAFYELVEAYLTRRPVVRRRWLVPAGAFLGVLVFGLVRLPMVDARAAAAPKLKVGMVQTNLGAKDKVRRGPEFIDRHLNMSRRLVEEHPDLDLIVWPETAYNRRVPRVERSLGSRLSGGFGKPMILGVLTAEETPDGRGLPYNSVVSTSSAGDIRSRFDKTVLLAFGETIPFVETYPGVRKYFPHSSVFGRGKSYAHLDVEGTRFLPMICYEDIIPAFVRRMWREAGPADVLVNVTNDSWYGDTHEPFIHLVLASFRSIETRRAMVRSTNTGVSAFIDPAGRITARSGQWEEALLVGEIPVLEDGKTTLYMYLGDALGWLALAGTLYGWLLVRRAERSRPAARAPGDPGKKRRKGGRSHGAV